MIVVLNKTVSVNPAQIALMEENASGNCVIILDDGTTIKEVEGMSHADVVRKLAEAGEARE